MFIASMSIAIQRRLLLPKLCKQIFEFRTGTKRNMSSKTDLDNAKQIAAHRAVDEWIKDKTAIGVGSGSTIVYAVERLAKRVADGLDVICVPTSYQARQLILQHGLKLSDLEQHPSLDVTIDGADEVDIDMVLIKGGGGCMLQEKLVASCSKKLIIVADYTKNSEMLGDRYKKGIPIEVVPLAYVPVTKRIEKTLGGQIKLRNGVNKAGPVITDNGNFILDWIFETNKNHDWRKVNTEIMLIPGVVETGIFDRMAHMVYYGMSDGSVKVQEKRKEN